jgi:hypothetical protein
MESESSDNGEDSKCPGDKFTRMGTEKGAEILTQMKKAKSYF